MTSITVSPDGQWYVVTFFPDAVEESVETNEEKGWKVTTGFLDGEGVPIRAYYRQDMYTLDDVKRFAENLRECEICKRLGRDMSVTSIDVANNYNRREQPAFSGPGIGLNRRQQPSVPIGDSGNVFMDMLFSTLVDTTLTPLGKILTAKITGNDALLEQALPKSDEEAFNITADYLSADTPKNMIFKDPKAMKEYATALRARTKTPEEVEEEEKPTYKRARTIIIS